MSYIGYSHASALVTPPHVRETLVPDGSATYFDLSNDVVGYEEANVTVVVNNVIQEPSASYTIINDANNQPRRLDFAGVALASTDDLYVIHQGTGTLYNTPAAGSVTKTSMAANMVSHTVDKFSGTDATTGSVTKTSLASNLVSHVVDKFVGSNASNGGNPNDTLTLSEIPTNRDAISVYVNGVYQRSGSAIDDANYILTGATLRFSSSLASTDQIDVHHHTFRSTTTKVAENSVGDAQLASGTLTTKGALVTQGAITGAGLLTTGGNIVIPNAGNIGSVGDTDSIAIASNGNVTLSQDLIVTGDFTVNGTTTTLDTVLTSVDKLDIGANSADHAAAIVQAGNGIGLKVTSSGTGNLFQFVDGSTNRFVMADGGATTLTGNLSITGTLTISSTITSNGDLETSTSKKVKQKGAFMQSSTHQSLFFGG